MVAWSLAAVSGVGLIVVAALPVSATLAGARIDCGAAGGALLPGDPGDYSLLPRFDACHTAALPYVLGFYAFGLLALTFGVAGLALWHRSARRRPS
jgi:hypothetical protein